MIQGEINKKLPGSRLYQFSEKYFEQPGLEKIAQPIIADLQQEYSCRPHPSLARLFILLRGYSGFWKAIILYSLFSDEGNIRIFKSIGFFRLLGAAVGVIVAALSWRGNQTPGFVSLLPDVLTAMTLLCLFCLAVWFCARQIQASRFPDIRWISGKISVPIGIILWTVDILLMFKLFHLPVPAVHLAFSVIGILGVVFVNQIVASLLVWGVFTIRKSMKAI
jgi:hypothetical protein